jgi:hypothetical protein
MIVKLYNKSGDVVEVNGESVHPSDDYKEFDCTKLVVAGITIPCPRRLAKMYVDVGKSTPEGVTLGGKLVKNGDKASPPKKYKFNKTLIVGVGQRTVFMDAIFDEDEAVISEISDINLHLDAKSVYYLWLVVLLIVVFLVLFAVLVKNHMT